ncbi:MAG: hypothetical protein O7B99_00955, partial [Planctomycetota bacterium]|nr:hypothetical protein [Planctomycetota bacterium]
MRLLGDAPKEKAVRVALAALVLAAPLVYVPRVLFGDATDEPLSPAPSWTHLIVVSASRWDAPLNALDQPAVGALAIAALDRRASRIDRMYAPSPSSAACAASLWTGRWPGNHGVLENDRALVAGTWTVAAGAREAGAATAAFLQEPFVSATGIAGFDEVRESPDLLPGEMTRYAAGFLADHTGERVVLWLHLHDAGAGGQAVAEVLAGLFTALEPDGRRFESIVLVCAFGSGDAVDPAAPFWLALPGALFAG